MSARRPGTTPAAAGVALAALLAGCGNDPAAPTPAASAAAPTASVTPSAAARQADPPDLDADPQTVATRLDVPWGLTFLPDGAALVAERNTARVLRMSPGAKPQEVYRVPGVVPAGEGGLLGLAASPGYAQDGWIYAYLTAERDNRIVRFKLSGGAAPEVIFDGIDKARNHDGGRIAFGPDGMLYVGTGDAGKPSAAQDLGDTNGKILRLTPGGDPAPGNPVAGSPVYSLGHRNVQGLAWDAMGRLFATEFGQNRFDEVNQIEPGGNYGWPVVEGAGGDSEYVEPLVTWPTDQASPSGAAIVGDTMYVAALHGARLWAV